MTIVYPSPGRVLICGDWHGSLNYAIKVLKAAQTEGINHILHVGDFGIWPGNEGQRFLNNLDEYLEVNGQYIWFIDGNHEDFNQLLSCYLDPETGLRKVRKNIMHIPRGYRWEWDDKVWMGLGGATSLDKPSRRENISWWPQEELTYADAKKATEGGKVDIMLTHDCPDQVEIPGLGDGYGWPVHELVRAQEHREFLGAIVDEVNPDVIFHGHFHRSYWGLRNNRDYTRTTIVGLDCDGVMLRDHAVIFDTETNQITRLGDSNE